LIPCACPVRRIDLEILHKRCKISRAIPRFAYQKKLERALGRNPVVALIGPRQCGKTTLARQILPLNHANYFDLEDPVVTGLMENPMTALEGLRGLAGRIANHFFAAASMTSSL